MGTIIFNKDGFPLWINVRMTGLVLITYVIRYYSALRTDRKILIQGRGNNHQTHDDFFLLFNPDNPYEPLSNHIDRILTFDAIIDNYNPVNQNFSIYLDLHQCMNQNEVITSPIVGTVKLDGVINATEGNRMVSLRIKLA